MNRRLGAVLVGAAMFVSGAIPGAAARPWKPGRAAAIRYADRRAGNVYFAAINEAGRRWAYHPHRQVEAVSVFKAMLLVTYLRMGSVRDRRLRESDRELLAPMIRWSNSYSASRVRDIVGHDRIRRLARHAGMRRFAVHRPWGLSQITARDQARFFYTIERYLPKRHEDYARYLLSHVVRSQRLGMADYVDDAMPAWRLFFKGGWGSGTGRWSHQVALLKKKGRRLTVAILTEHSPSHRYANRTMRGVARRLLRTR